MNDGTITPSETTELVDTILLSYDSLSPQERLILTPDIFSRLDPNVQKRIRKAVEKYSSEILSAREKNNLFSIVEQFNMLTEEQRSSINAITLQDFHGLSVDDQQDVLLTIFHSPEFQQHAQKELGRDTPLTDKELFDCYQGSIVIESGVFAKKMIPK